MPVVLKILISAVLIALITEVAKRSALLGAALASLPLVSILAMVWLYVDTRDVAQVIRLSNGIFWLVLPSLTLFVLLPIFIRWGWHFAWALSGAAALTMAVYFCMIVVLGKFGIKF